MEITHVSNTEHSAHLGRNRQRIRSMAHLHVAGNVLVGQGAYIGTGANIINGTPTKPLVIGDGCIIAAGACVTGSTDARSLYAGVPARMKKVLD